MTPKKPAPSAPASSGTEDPFAQLQQQVQDLGGGAGTTVPDLYGLGQWRTQKIDPSGFPPNVALALQNAGLNVSTPMTGQQLAQELSTMHGAAATQAIQLLQQMLYWSGAYGPSVKSLSDVTLGQFGDKDVKALSNAITTAGQTGSAFGTYLGTSANYGKANGILSTIAGANQNPLALPDQATEDTVLRAKAQTLFGHDPSAAEYARFRAFFNQEIINGARSKTQAQTDALQQLPSASDLGQALENDPNSQFAMTTTPAAPQQQMTTGFGGQPIPAGTSTQFGPFKSGLQDGGDAAYQAGMQRQQAAQQVEGQVTGVASGIDNQGFATYTPAPSIDVAAEDFLRRDNPGAIGANNVANKYSTLLSILGGNG